MTMTPEERKIARREATRRYRLNHPDRRKASQKRYAAKNRNKIRARQAAWWKANPEKASQYRKRWWRENPNSKKVNSAQKKKHAARIRKYNRKYRRLNPDKAKEWRNKFITEHRETYLEGFRRIHRANPERAVNAKAKRRARIGDDRLTRGLTQKLLVTQNGACNLCKAEFGDSTPHRDHIIPLSRGGRNVDSNIR